MRSLTKKQVLAGLLWFCFVSPASASLARLDTVGQTYPIAELDFLTEVETRVQEVDWEKVIDKDKMKDRVKQFQPPGMQKLPRALNERSYFVDPTYILDIDIPDPSRPNEILYPRGYSFNPLDYRPLTAIIVVINGADPDQVAWFETTPYFEDQRTKLLLADGNYYELMMRFKRPVYYLFEAHSQRMQLEKVPAVVMQSGRMLSVSEYYVEPGFALQQEKAHAKAR